MKDDCMPTKSSVGCSLEKPTLDERRGIHLLSPGDVVRLGTTFWDVTGVELHTTTECDCVTMRRVGQRRRMQINGLDRAALPKLREAAEAIAKLWDNSLAEYKAFVAPLPRRMKVADRERAAYLKGVLAGHAQATREIEKRCPIEFVGSGHLDSKPK